MRHVAHKGEIRNEMKTLARNHSEIVGVDRMIILK
jgi:hypothetical protein